MVSKAVGSPSLDLAACCETFEKKHRLPITIPLELGNRNGGKPRTSENILYLERQQVTESKAYGGQYPSWQFQWTMVLNWFDTELYPTVYRLDQLTCQTGYRNCHRSLIEPIWNTAYWQETAGCLLEVALECELSRCNNWLWRPWQLEHEALHLFAQWLLAKYTMHISMATHKDISIIGR